MRQSSVVWEWDDGSIDRVHLAQSPGGWRISGRHSDARYVIDLDPDFRCLSLDATCGEESCTLTRTPLGWLDAQSDLIPGSADVSYLDLGWSAITNSFPMRRLMAEGRDAGTFDVLLVTLPALEVTHAQQTYARAGAHWHYQNHKTGFSSPLVVDKEGLVTEYPGICTRRI